MLVGFWGTVIPSEDVVGSQSCFKSLVLSPVFVLLSIFHQVNTNLNLTRLDNKLKTRIRIY